MKRYIFPVILVLVAAGLFVAAKKKPAAVAPPAEINPKNWVVINENCGIAFTELSVAGIVCSAENKSLSPEEKKILDQLDVKMTGAAQGAVYFKKDRRWYRLVGAGSAMTPAGQ